MPSGHVPSSGRAIIGAGEGGAYDLKTPSISFLERELSISKTHPRKKRGQAKSWPISPHLAMQSGALFFLPQN